MAFTSKLKDFVSFSRQIIGVGRNYRCLLVERGLEADKEPVTFFKLPSAYIQQGQNIQIPAGCTKLVHEVELGVVISKTGHDIPRHTVMDYVGGYVLALDMTCASGIEQAQKSGLPWSLAKGFVTSCPVGPFVSKDLIDDPSNLRLWLSINGQIRQDGNTRDMVVGIEDLISYWSRHFVLGPGDLMLTGSPAGPGPVQSGDVLQAGLGDISKVTFHVA